MNTETATPSAKTTRRFLTQAEKYNLCKWYEANAPRLLTIHDIAIIKEAEEKLGIQGMTIGHMAAARESLGIQKRLKIKEGKAKDIEDTVLELVDQVRALEARIKVLESL